MSAAARDHIAQIAASVALLEERLAALNEVRDAIHACPSFTADERARVAEEVDRCESDLHRKRDVHARACTLLQTTIAQCETDLEAREALLNELFDRPALAKHQDLMQLFTTQHCELQRTLSRPFEEE